MDQLAVPFIFAYSSHVDSKVINKCAKSGFNECFGDKLSHPKILDLIERHIEAGVVKLILQDIPENEKKNIELIIKSIDFNKKDTGSISTPSASLKTPSNSNKSKD